MSWFDGTALANLAKSALKEAQRTIDKALDIQEDVETEVTNQTDTPSNEFFTSWGLEEENRALSDEDKSTMKEQWGSFTGSFFNNPIIDPNKSKNIDLIATQPHKVDLLLEKNDKITAPLATPESGLTPSEDSSTTELQINRDVDGSDKENIERIVKNDDVKTTDTADSDAVFLHQSTIKAGEYYRCFVLTALSRVPVEENL